MTTDTDQALEIELTSQITAAYVSNNPIAADQIPQLIAAVSQAIAGLSSGADAPEEEKKAPAVSVRKSLKDDHLVCLEDGLKFQSLKRHLRTHHDLTPDQYRKKWGLSHDYPMVAPAYAARRSELAKAIGLGVKGGRKKK